MNAAARTGFRPIENLHDRPHHPQAHIGGHHADARTHQNRINGQFAQALERNGQGGQLLAQSHCDFENIGSYQQGFESPNDLKPYLVKKVRLLHIKFEMLIMADST